jgi:hypothetical protein
MQAYSNNDVRTLTGDVLLFTPTFDWDLFRMQLLQDWNIEVLEEAVEDSLVFKIGDVTVACSLMKEFKEGSVEAADRSQEWAEAAEVVKRHTAYIEVGILDCTNPLQRNVLFTMVSSSMLKAENAVGLYRYPVVYRAGNYTENAEALKNDQFPILNWVYIGIYKKENGNFGGYTYGLEDFGKEEIEIPETQNGAYALYQFLYQLCSYVISNNDTLEDGQTIGTSEKNAHTITRSAGVVLEGTTVKIDF